MNLNRVENACRIASLVAMQLTVVMSLGAVLLAALSCKF